MTAEHEPLRVEGIHRRFRSRGGDVRAVDGVDLAVAPGEIVGLVGESGCGKTTLARIAVGLDRPDAGAVWVGGRRLVGTDGRVPRDMRRRVQYVFQDPTASFNPRRPIGGSVGMPLGLVGVSGAAARERVATQLESVGLDRALAGREPHELSGGQLQRAAIARALIVDPDILVCDEPVASLDVSVRAQLLNLLLDLRRDRGIGILFVSHDLGVVRHLADRVLVMYLGRIVESGPGPVVFRAPHHPYTRSLAASVPSGTQRWRGGHRPPLLEGEPPSPVAMPPGCRFHPRCPIAIDRCRTEDPQLRTLGDGVEVACHLAT